MTSSVPIVFIDTETTALGPLARPWEIAIIRREPDGSEQEHVFHVDFGREGPPAGTSPYALDIGGYTERVERDGVRRNSYLGAVSDHQGVRVGYGPEWAIAHIAADVLKGEPTLVGVGVHFDAVVLSAMFLRHCLPPEPWHYAIHDLKAATWGYMRARARAVGLPVRSEAIAAALCVGPPTAAERHTALGDARWARRWFDALAGGTE